MTRMILALGLFCLPAAALAEDNVWQTGAGFTIRTGDISLSDADGRATLLKRVEFAGRKLCAKVKPRRRFNKCVDASTARAMQAGPEPMRRSLELAIRERARQDWAAR